MNSILWNLPQRNWESTTQNQWWGLTNVTPPADEPVSLDEAKLHLRVDYSDEDTLISALVTTARQYIEDVCGRALMPQQWDLWLQQWPAGTRIFLPMPPVRTVDFVKYTDSTETAYTVDPSTYVANVGGDLAEVVLRFGQIWPPVVLSQSRPINVRFTTGYDSVPAPLKHAMKLLVGHWYINRESSSLTSSSRGQQRSMDIPDGVTALITRYRMLSYSPDPLRP